MSANAGCQYNVECLFLGEYCISANQASLLRVQWKIYTGGVCVRETFLIVILETT